MRVVSTTCSNTEIVCALGLGDLLVGVDNHSDYPADVVGRLPRVGPDLGIDVEKVRTLAPDLVLASLTVPGHERVVDALVGAGFDVYAPETVTIRDVYADVREIAHRLGAPERGERLVAEMKSVLEARLPAPARRPRLLVEWWPKPVIVPGRDSWVTELCAAVGGENPFAALPVKSQPVSDQSVLRAAPDAIVIAWCGVPPAKYRPEIVYRRPAWQALEAVARRRVYCVPEAFLGRPGPRLCDGFAALRAIVDASD